MDAHLVLVVTGELRDVLAHGTRQPNEPVFDEHHARGRGDRLAQRRQREQRVAGRLGRVGLGTQPAEGLLKRDDTPARNQRHSGGMNPVLDPAGGQFAQTVEPCRGEPGLAWRAFSKPRHGAPPARLGRSRTRIDCSIRNEKASAEVTIRAEPPPRRRASLLHPSRGDRGRGRRCTPMRARRSDVSRRRHYRRGEYCVDAFS